MVHSRAFLWILLTAIHAIGKAQSPSFEHIGTREGLSQNNVNCILQDNRGFIWVATRDGLNRYDGYQFITYRYSLADTNSISDNFVSDIAEDAQGILWLATRNGLSRFDRNTGSFTRYIHSPKNPASIAGNVLNRLAPDDQGHLWIATEMDGLDCLHIASGRFEHYRYSAADSTSLGDNNIRTVYIDPRQRLWVGTFNGGLHLFDEKTRTFRRLLTAPGREGGISAKNITCLFGNKDGRLWVGSQDRGLFMQEPGKDSFHCYKYEEKNGNSISANTIFALNEDDKGNLWIGTENGGLSILDQRTGIFHRYQHDDVDRYSINGNSIYSIFRDRSDNMWMGAFSAGISLYKRNMSSFIHYRHSSSPASLSNNYILDIFEDSRKNIWIATDGGGINVLAPGTDSMIQYRHQEGVQGSLSSNYVLTIKEAQNKDLYIGTWGGGVTIFNPAGHSFRTLRHDPDNPNSIGSDNIFAILPGKDGKTWIGTANAGLDHYDRSTGTFLHYRHRINDARSISSDLILSLLEDREGRLWIGTYDNGLNLLDHGSDTFTHYPYDTSGHGLSNNSVPDIFQDSRGNLWISTFHGLNKFDPLTKKFTIFTTASGLPGDIIYAVREDDTHNLWISTNKGLSVYHPALGTFRNYTTEDGLQSDEFKPHSALKTSDGRLFFGGVNGFNVFSPGQIVQPANFSPLVITSFKIFNRPVALADNSHEITLSHLQSFIGLEYAALDYAAADARKYAYMLEGFDHEWNYVGSRNTALYTNLPPGQYVFSLKYQNSSGQWSPVDQKFRIVIIPPVWLTWWFKAAAIICLGAAIYGYGKFRVRAARIQQQRLQRRVREQTEEVVSQKLALEAQQDEISQKNASLQGLIGEKDRLLLEKEWLLKEVHHRVKNNLQIVISLLNTQSTYLDNKEAITAIGESMRRMQAMSLVHQKLYQSENVAMVDMLSYIRELTGYLHDDFNTGLRLHFRLKIEPVELSVALAVPIGLILNEAITNAIKHAFPGNMKGTITIILQSIDNDHLLLGIHDNGIGSRIDLDSSPNRSLGMTLMKGMASQIEGTFSARNDGGLDIRVEFPRTEQ